MRAYLDAMRRYATFAGRTSREEFWRAHLVFLPLILLAFGVFGLPLTGGSRSVWPLLFFVLIILPHVVPWTALTVRRLHDMDFRGWWALLALLPIVVVMPLGVLALLAWACLRGTPGPNRFGSAPIGAAAPISPSVSPAGSPTARASRDPVAEIERLAQLRASGALTEAEFENLKARALGSA